MAIEITLYDPISPDNPDRILQPVEARDLREDRALGIDLIATEDLRYELRIEVAVFFRQWVDRRIEQILRNRKLPREFRRRKQGAVVSRDEFLEEVPDCAIGMRKIDVASPHPMIRPGRARLNESGGLRIMNHHKLGVQGEGRAIAFAVSEKNFEILRAGVIRRAVQGIVEGLGNLKKILAAHHHVPFDVDFQLFRERHQPVQNFRDAPANGGGINHLDAAAAQRFRKSAKFLNLAGAKQFGILIQWNPAEGQGLTHAFLLSRSISRSSLARALSKVLV